MIDSTVLRIARLSYVVRGSMAYSKLSAGLTDISQCLS